MSFSLKNAFFNNSRGLSYTDGGGITWAFNSSTNTITAAYSGAGSAGAASPAAKVGLSTVNGVAATFMRSDAAPPIDQAIAPVWAGAHAFTGGFTEWSPNNPNSSSSSITSVQILGGNSAQIVQINSSAGANLKRYDSFVDASGVLHFRTVNDANNGAADWLTVSRTIVAASGAKFSCMISMNGNAVPAQSTGWGTPTGGSVQNNFAGSSATLASTGAAVAQIITILKNFGLLAA